MGRVAIEGVRKKYGALEVIHGLNIDIEEGEFVVLVGPSGCGKSTLLRMIAGLEEISGGTISIGETRVNDLPPKDRDISMVFQNYALYPHMNVEQNMGFSLKLRRRSRADIRKRVEEAASILGLTNLLGRYPRQLSGGQRQRVAMGRAIVRDPAVFLFDEPLSNLDAKLRVQMRAEVKGLHQRLKTTTVYVTHDQIEAMTMADKIVVMLDGNIEQIGSPLELYDRPLTRFVAGFIGSPSMNFIRGTVNPAKPNEFVGDDGTKIDMGSPRNVPAGLPVVLGIRPEHIEICGTDAPDAVHGSIVVLEPTGSETIVQSMTAGTPMTALVRERVSARPGSTLGFRFSQTHMHLFDASIDNGRRLAG